MPAPLLDFADVASIPMKDIDQTFRRNSIIRLLLQGVFVVVVCLLQQRAALSEDITAQKPVAKAEATGTHFSFEKRGKLISTAVDMPKPDGKGDLATDERATPPYGVCAHLGGGSEHEKLDEELDRMKEAGIGWVRADFTWGSIEPKDGQFRFDRYDKVVDAAKARGINVLPILCYNSPWAGYAHENLDAWARFVRKVTERYGDRLRYWEVWNEENISFWKPEPDARQYAMLLEVTYETIKSVNSRLQVMYGGTAGIPLKYIRQTFELGAAKHFDVMAIHPYCYPATVEASGRVKQLAELRDLLTQFGTSQRIWITETGWPTHVDADSTPSLALWESLTRTAAARQFPGKTNLRVAVVVDPEYSGAGTTARATAEHFQRSGWDCRTVTLGELATLTPNDADILLGLFGERFPKPSFEQMVRFVRDGGLLAHFGGVPLYYADDRVDGKWSTRGPGAPGTYRAALHIGWEAWWTRRGLPKQADTTRAADGVDGVKLPKNLITKRWFTDGALKPGDRFVPLLAGYNGDTFVGYPSALYLLRSDLKGAVLVNCLPIPQQRGVSRDTQAAMLSRAYLAYLALGIDVYCWYEFRDGGLKPDYNEHNFGMVDYRVTPKPAYQALKAMTGLLGQSPTFDGPPRTVVDGLMRVDIAATDGRRYSAFWAEGTSGTLRLDPARTRRVFSHLGKPVEPTVENGRQIVELGLAPVFVEAEAGSDSPDRPGS